MVNAGAETSCPPSPAMSGLGAQNVAELVQLLATTKLENERQWAAAIPRLRKHEVEKLMAESMPYQWTSSGAEDICEEGPSMGRARAGKDDVDGGA